MGKSNVSRRFLGKTENFENKEEQRQEQKHLKAYLSGHETYQYGFKTVKGTDGLFKRVPNILEVKQEIIENEL